jgi:ribosomal protein S18 acetylase RimI-like enzyme
MKFIKATPKNLKELHKFEKKCFDRPEDQFSIRSLRHLMTVPTALTLLVTDEKGKIIGEVIGLLRHFKIPSGRVYKIAVDPEIQKKGLGTVLLKKIEEWFCQKKMKKSCAEVRENNRASRAMFVRNGYELTSPLPGYYKNGENGVKFWKEL